MRPTRRGVQRGTVLLFGLIAMTILLISAVALVRSFNGTLFNAGNVAFKRDLLNRAERVWPVVLAAVQTGALATSAARSSHLKSSNYRAMNLPDLFGRGMPNALYDRGTFLQVGEEANDIDAGDGVTIRYMVDRLCSEAGSSDPPNVCTLASDGSPAGGGSKTMKRAENGSAAASAASSPASSPLGALKKEVVYRISIRVTGPRNTQAFYQTTFSQPE